jgi:hypothetical protein
MSDKRAGDTGRSPLVVVPVRLREVEGDTEVQRHQRGKQELLRLEAQPRRPDRANIRLAHRSGAGQGSEPSRQPLLEMSLPMRRGEGCEHHTACATATPARADVQRSGDANFA